MDEKSLTPDEKRLKAAYMKKALASRLKKLSDSALAPDSISEEDVIGDLVSKR